MTHDDTAIDVKLDEVDEALAAAEARAPTGESWSHLLTRNGQGHAHDTIFNVATVLRNDPAFAGRLGYNELTCCVNVAATPWDEARQVSTWTDLDDIHLTEWLERHGLRSKLPTVANAVQAVASERRYHPVRDWLSGLTWDGTPRVDDWLTWYLGVPSTPYVRAVGRAWLISAVARVFEPGCKADHVLILEGPQGAGKSSAAGIIAVRPEWFADEIADLGSKDGAQDLRGKWIVELGELSAVRRSDNERLKAFLSRTTDHYRPSYGRRSQDFPRQNVFIGTTNADTYLPDATGGRRFWPVKVGTIRLDALRDDMPQIWAEACAAYENGEPWHLSRESEALAREQQAERQCDDPWTDRVMAWAEERPFVTLSEILTDALGFDIDRVHQRDEKRVGEILRRHGWQREAQRRVAGKRVRPWCPPLSPVTATASGTGDALVSATTALVVTRHP